MGKVDLHIHSTYSDGTYSVRELLDRAKENQVSVLSITDHNVIDAYQEEILNQSDIKVIRGVEIDAHAYGSNIHILAYQYDYSNLDFANFVKSNYQMLELFDEGLLWKMNVDYPEITKEDYESFEANPKHGGWKSLNYLIDKGICRNLFDFFAFCEQYGHSNHDIDYPSAANVVDQIHKANGYAVLAHPGRMKYNSIDEFKSLLCKIVLENKMDGVECYYPTHSKEITEICLNFCKDHDLMITCGSDCHGTFQKTDIGEVNITLDDLNISKLM